MQTPEVSSQDKQSLTEQLAHGLTPFEKVPFKQASQVGPPDGADPGLQLVHTPVVGAQLVQLEHVSHEVAFSLLVKVLGGQFWQAEAVVLKNCPEVHC